jgi:hypothetical protein
VEREEVGTCLSGQLTEALEDALADGAGGEQAAVGAALGRGLQQPGLLGRGLERAGEGDAGEQVGVVAGEDVGGLGEAERAQGDAEQAEGGAAGEDALLAVGVADGEGARGVGEQVDVSSARRMRHGWLLPGEGAVRAAWRAWRRRRGSGSGELRGPWARTVQGSWCPRGQVAWRIVAGEGSRSGTGDQRQARASSRVKIWRQMAIAQAQVLSTPKYERLLDSRLWRRE